MFLISIAFAAIAGLCTGNRLSWLLMTFFQVFLCSSIVWMAAAGTRFSVGWLWAKLKS